MHERMNEPYLVIEYLLTSTELRLEYSKSRHNHCWEICIYAAWCDAVHAFMHLDACSLARSFAHSFLGAGWQGIGVWGQCKSDKGY